MYDNCVCLFPFFFLFTAIIKLPCAGTMADRVGVQCNSECTTTSSYSSPLHTAIDGGHHEDVTVASRPRNESTTEPSSTMLCRYFAIGICRFGSLCRFSHDPMLLENQTANDSMNHLDINTPSATAIGDEQYIHDAVPKSLPLSNNRIVISDPASWINAPVFVPKHLTTTIAVDETADEAAAPAQPLDGTADVAGTQSYAQILSAGNCNVQPFVPQSYIESTETLCPYVRGTPVIGPNNEVTMLCPYGEQCVYKHGCQCDMCGQFCLHPTDVEQRKRHQTVSSFCPIDLFSNDILSFRYHNAFPFISHYLLFGRRNACDNMRKIWSSHLQ